MQQKETVRRTDYSTVVQVNGDTADGLSCIERVNNGILPFVERMVGRRLVILGDGGHEILPARAEIHQPGQ